MRATSRVCTAGGHVVAKSRIRFAFASGLPGVRLAAPLTFAMLSDLRFALHLLVRNRWFAAVTVLTLALGLGAAAAIYSVSDWILFRANPFPSDVYLIGGRSDQQGFNPLRFDYMVRAYETQTAAISDFAKAAACAGNIVIDGQPVGASWTGVSVGMFPMLGISPSLGRGFLPGEDVAGADGVVVVSYRFWQQHLGGKADALGRKIVVGDSVCTVVGVLDAMQTTPAYLWNDVYRPLVYRSDPERPWEPNLFLLGRLRPGVTREQAAQVLAAAKLDVPMPMQQYFASDRPALSSMDELRQLFRPEIYWVMLGGVGFLYAIACLNASNLLLVHQLGRRRELSIRLALGGTRWRVGRLLAIESAVLALAATAVGALVANWVFPLLLRATGSSFYSGNWASWTLGWRTIAVLGGLGLATSLLIAIIPAVRVCRADISAGLKDGGAALGESPLLARLRGLLVVLQAAFAVVLLAGAGLMIRTFHRLESLDLGFDPAGRAKVMVSFPAGYHVGRDSRLARLREIREELLRQPGVREVGFGNDVVMPGYYFATNTVEGPEGRPVRTALVGINGTYGAAAGLRLKRGRWLDRPNGNEILVNEALARECWPRHDAVGQLLRTSGDPSADAQWKGWEVIGVVQDVRSSLRESARPCIYGPEGWGPENFNLFVLQLTRECDADFAAALRRRLFAYDPQIVVMQTQSIRELRDNQLWLERMADSVLKVLAALALTLAVVGLFSVLSYTVDRRMGEFGVRMALGATRQNLMALVLQRGVRLVVLGIALGLCGAAGLTRSLQSLLFETSPLDWRVFAVVAAVLLATALLACALPARRASRVDVARLLRTE